MLAKTEENPACDTSISCPFHFTRLCEFADVFRCLLRSVAFQARPYNVFILACAKRKCFFEAHGCVDQNCRQLTKTAAVHQETPSARDQYGRTPQCGKRRRFIHESGNFYCRNEVLGISCHLGRRFGRHCQAWLSGAKSLTFEG